MPKFRTMFSIRQNIQNIGIVLLILFLFILLYTSLALCHIDTVINTSEPPT